MQLPNQVGDILATGIAGCWAFLGGVMRGGADWRDPSTKLFSWPRFGASVATALVLGEIATAICLRLHWEPTVVGAIAGGCGYLGPAATMGFFQKRFFGEKDASGNSAKS